MKKKIIVFAALACALGMAVETGIGRPALAAVEAGLDDKFRNLWPEDPYSLLGTTRGLYLDGYGAVFTAELKLVSAPPPMPMLPPVPNKDTIDRLHQQKVERLAKLRTAMRGFLVDTASSLDMVPADQQVVLAVTLSRYRWENTANVPSHILMQGRRGDLLQARSGGPAALEQTIQVQEY